jgi:hypothetical protein
MTRDWAAVRAILMQPVQERRAQGSLWVSWMLIGIMLLFSVLAMKSNKHLVVFALGVGIPLFLLVVMWWVLLFGSLLTQCSAPAMQLAPHMRERTMHAFLLAWAAATLSLTLVIGVPVGYPGQVAVVVGLGLLEITVMFSPWRLGLAAALLWIRWYAGIPMPAWFLDFLAGGTAVALGAVLVVLDGRAALLRMFGKPGVRRPWTLSKRPAPTILPDVVRLLQTARADRSSGQPLIARVLGPAAFSGSRTVLVVLVVACVAIRALIEMQGTGSAHDRLLMTRAMVLIGMLELQALLAYKEAGRVYQRQAEQALVRLSVAAPVAAGINRLLARYFVTGFAGMWAGCSAVTVAMLLVLGANASEALGAAAACTPLLLLAGLPLRDYARGKESDLVATLVYFFVSLSAVALGIEAIRGKVAVNAWGALALASVVLAAVFVWRRWHTMLKAAPAYPAGRQR